MTKKSLARYGTVLRCFDNGGKTADRYTILPPYWAHDEWKQDHRMWQGLGASENPYHPQGFGQWITAQAGSHLGKRVHWDALPVPVQHFVAERFPAFAPPGAPEPDTYGVACPHCGSSDIVEVNCVIVYVRVNTVRRGPAGRLNVVDYGTQHAIQESIRVEDEDVPFRCMVCDNEIRESQLMLRK